METPTNDPVIAALLREREGYVTRGMDDRVAAVDEQLKLRGHKATEKPQRSDPPAARRGRPRSTTEDE